MRVLGVAVSQPSRRRLATSALPFRNGARLLVIESRMLRASRRRRPIRFRSLQIQFDPSIAAKLNQPGILQYCERNRNCRDMHVGGLRDALSAIAGPGRLVAPTPRLPAQVEVQFQTCERIRPRRQPFGGPIGERDESGFHSGSLAQRVVGRCHWGGNRGRTILRYSPYTPRVTVTPEVGARAGWP